MSQIGNKDACAQGPLPPPDEQAEAARADVIPVDGPLTWREIVSIADGASPALSRPGKLRLERASVARAAAAMRATAAYGINTGVGALCDVVIEPGQQARLSRNIVMSHAAGIGPPLPPKETRAIMAAQISQFLQGASGVRPGLVEALCALLAADCLPVVPSRGSVGYLSHAAAIALVLIGSGHARQGGEMLSGAEAMARTELAPFVLEAKEGLSLVNGTPCASGLACLALDRAERLLDWADASAAMTCENVGAQRGVFDAELLALRSSDALARTGATLRAYLEGSALLARAAGSRLQDPLSLRAIPHYHAAVRDALSGAEAAVARELAAVTDNPALAGEGVETRVLMGAQAVGIALALALDRLAIAAASLATMVERRIDRLVNPLVSGLPPFLAGQGGLCSGMMIAQYTAVALVAENRRLAAAASLDGGITSGLQEDVLAHATPAATKLLAILDNVAHLLAIEALCAAQAYDVQEGGIAIAPRTDAVRRQIREAIPTYSDDRPLNADFAAMRAVMEAPPRGCPEVRT